jgi:hypothetical protein
MLSLISAEYSACVQLLSVAMVAGASSTRFPKKRVQDASSTLGVKHRLDCDFALYGMDLIWGRTGNSFARSDGSININVRIASQTFHGFYYFREYESFRHHSTIGEFYTRNPFGPLEATIVHEIAHAAHFRIKKTRGMIGKPHGCIWKILYAKLGIKNGIVP